MQIQIILHDYTYQTLVLYWSKFWTMMHVMLEKMQEAMSN